MYRATTPVHYFRFDTDPSLYKEILITYAQGDKIVLEKHKADLQFKEEKKWNKYTAYFRLTQEETKLFSASIGASPVFIQIRVMTDADEVLASDKKRVTVQSVLNDEVMT